MAYPADRPICRQPLAVERKPSLTCRECRKEFASALAMEPPTLTQLKVENNLERCPHCGFARRYQKADYFFI